MDMASNDDDALFTPTDKASIALLRCLRAGGGDGVHFVHRVDVCAAPPEVLVADLKPVPGTGLDDHGHSRIWYFYHAKKFTNKQGKLSGYRQRQVTGGGGASWHKEISPQDVEGSGGGTFCKFSYGFKDRSSPLDRMGWCMVEYDLVAAGEEQQSEYAANDSRNYVLCKVYQSPRAKEKSASASSASAKIKRKVSSSKNQTAKKRKAGGDDHPEAPPAKLIQHPEPPPVQHQDTAYYPTPCYEPQDVQQPADPGGDFNFNIEEINFYVDETEPEPEPEPGQQQSSIAEPEPEHDLVLLAAEATVGEMLGQETAVQQQLGDKDEPQQPIVEPLPGHGGEFIRTPWGLVVPVAVAKATVEDMLLGLGPETMYGYSQWSGGRSSSSYAPTSSPSNAGCSRLLQGPDDSLLRLPYLSC